nr:DnaA regulatory inactivator Hda [Gammaproteobacteria bacterium]
YNRARDNGTRLIIAANQAPLQLNCQLADLRSRLGAGLIFKVQALDDYEKLAALCLRAERRGMYLSPEVGRYVLHHYTRSMPDLTAVLDKLDEASLTAKRRLTIPFVKAVLAG